MFHSIKMRPFIFPLTFLLFVYLAYSQKSGQKNAINLQKDFLEVTKIYSRANSIYDDAGDDTAQLKISDSLYRQVLGKYLTLVQPLIDNHYDSIATKASFYAGLIYHNFDSLEPALKQYLQAIQIKKSNNILADSILFQPYLFAGSIYYKKGNYDSALYYYNRAEDVKAKYQNFLEEEPRLYNVLGILSYETGNLRQSINYVQKALSLMKQTNNTDEALITNYQLNLAAAHIRLEEYEDAKKILELLVQKGIYKDEINQKLGFIAVKENKYTAALNYYKKVINVTGKKLIDLYLNKSKAYVSLHQYDSAAYYVAKAKAELIRDKNNYSKTQHGILAKTEAELEKENNNLFSALRLYQQAIIYFSNNFGDTSALSNPNQFNGAFLYIDLFNVLNDKAETLESIYMSTKESKYLEASLNSYKSGYQLSAYIEKTYNSDEARLFLNKIKYINHHKPIDISLRLYELTKKKIFLEDAIYFDQSNKASSLTLGMAENDLKTSSEKASTLLKKIRSVKTTITSTSISSSNITDSSSLMQIHNILSEKEIELNKLQEELKKQPEWKFRVEKGQIPPLAEIQKKLNPKSALVSYHLSEKEVLAFVITRNKAYYQKTPVDSSFYIAAELYKQTLHTTLAGQRYTGASIAKYLFRLLVSPIQNKLTQIDHLVIIPDDELHYLPFESLQDGNGRYVIEKFSIQYLYSTALFYTQKKYNKHNGTLSIAPFSFQGYKTSQNDFPKLSASLNEIKNLNGLMLTDSAATKHRFLSEINRYPVVHLATHAIADNEDAKKSFIAFSPTDSNNKLYGSEIYNLRLDSTELVILSACETGIGQLIKGEGLMSLSRAFAYAGCRNIITSLWRAEDITTSFIMQRLHEYLAKGYSKPRALQAAKIDLLKSNEINPSLKTPNYWAHIVFIGDYEEERSSTNWVWVASAIVLFGILYLLILLKKPR
jgi:CHAT domain-containing protein